MLHAFKENAELLLGEDADKLIPYSPALTWLAEQLSLDFLCS